MRCHCPSSGRFCPRSLVRTAQSGRGYPFLNIEITTTKMAITSGASTQSMPSILIILLVKCLKSLPFHVSNFSSVRYFFCICTLLIFYLMICVNLRKFCGFIAFPVLTFPPDISELHTRQNRVWA